MYLLKPQMLSQLVFRRAFEAEEGTCPQKQAVCIHILLPFLNYLINNKEFEKEIAIDGKKTSQRFNELHRKVLTTRRCIQE
jgi:hypothetical protein